VSFWTLSATIDPLSLAAAGAWEADKEKSRQDLREAEHRTIS
jgi:hypothetical protein